LDTDHLNTPRLVADATGTTVWRWDQAEPFGNNPADEDPDSNSVAFDLPLRLPGQRYDKESGLHYNYFRDYDTGIGRYVQSDPIGLRGGINTYGYVEGKPLEFVDPVGLVKWEGVVTIAFVDVMRKKSFYAAGPHKGEWALTSECVRGVKWRVTVEEKGWGMAIGRSLTGRLDGSTSTTTLDDGLDYINPYIQRSVLVAVCEFACVYGEFEIRSRRCARQLGRLVTQHWLGNCRPHR